MEAIRVFRNVNAVDKFLGLELADGCILLFTFFTAFLVNREGLLANGLALVLVYLGLRTLKRGKPAGYMLVLSRYVLMSRYKRAPAFGEREALKPLGER